MAKPKLTPGPFAKVTKQTSLPLHEHCGILRKEKQQNQQYKATSEQATSKMKGKVSTPAQSKNPAPVSQPPTKREGLHGVEYTYKNDTPPKRVIHRTCDDSIEATKSDLPLSDSEEDFIQVSQVSQVLQVSSGKEDEEDAEGYDEDEEGEGDGVAVKALSGIEGGQSADGNHDSSDVETVLEDASDARDFAVEYGQPLDLGPPALNHKNADDLSKSTHASNLSALSGTGSDALDFVVQGHETGVPECVEEPKRHPFGLPQDVQPALNIEDLTPEDLVLFDFFPVNPISTCNPFYDPSNAITYNFNFPSSNNALGIAGIPLLLAEALAPYAQQMAPYAVSCSVSGTMLGSHDFQPGGQLFMDQIQGESIPGLAAEPHPVAMNTPVESLLCIDLRPPATLASHTSTAPPKKSYIRSEMQLSAGTHAGMPYVGAQMLVHPQTPMLTPSCPFSRSVSAPLQAPLRTPSWQLGGALLSNTHPTSPAGLPHHSCTLTRSPALPHDGNPSTPAPSTPAPSTPAPPAPIHAMPHTAQLQVAMGDMETIDDFTTHFINNNSSIGKELDLGAHRSLNSDVNESGGAPVMGGSAALEDSVVPPSVKHCRLLLPKHIPPTDEEINVNLKVEYKNIKARCKAGPPKPGASRPRKGNNKGAYLCEQQEFMNVGRANISWEQISNAPWSDAPEEQEDRVIEYAKQVMGMSTDFVNKEFKDTMIWSDSQDHARCMNVVLKFAGKVIQGSPHTIEQHILNDLFLYEGDPS
ncbi:hypothetical protein FRC11_005913, partial [Ceratobasidium sp. 423]